MRVGDTLIRVFSVYHPERKKSNKSGDGPAFRTCSGY
nr:MAG TPA: hypothetical protein [Caudoviricetes sp.]